MKFKLSPLVMKVLQTFESGGFEIYVVGGAVRDILTKTEVKDWDFTTDATPEEIQKLFPDSFYDNSFGTVGVELGKKIMEITTFRSEAGYSDRRRPDKVVWGNSLHEDLHRRDFTINAMALDAAQLGFSIEPKTLAAINKNSALINQIAGERVRDELLKILTSSFPKDGVLMLFVSRLLPYILPELIETREIKQAGHHTKDVWLHSLDSLAACPSPDPIVRLATLLHDIGKPAVKASRAGKKITFYNHEVIGARMTKIISRRLRLSKKDSDLLWLLVRWHMFAYDPKMTDKAIRRFIRRISKENINNMIMLRIGDRVGGGSKATSWRLREFQERIGQVLYTPMQITDLKINGRDVMAALNIQSGPKVGKILKKLFGEVMDDAAKNDREYLLKRIKEIYHTPGV
ncbi:MAG: tRNA adenylyl-/cytidylyl-transferase [Candidatus Beckwithbacteria bacterium GW2011_GWA2_43_10]|uniref:tRNA adenylyl-/cytidylyl-transferase n=1 Tax=Candidatus Beckwithbacteria bacterium GW2011_GWA2_43_10 TaxID=1618369 RepID=A0A0G1C4E4_9BACT|nr:MAG: tRNA adenylyl-/cytidylyl-transferase [Candidatus Beckwithbacteria bacterium GW2011_GWA2_43_10]